MSRPDGAADRPTEVELTLAVVDPAPRRVVERLAALDRVGSRLRLVDGGARTIHDTYYDTPGGALGRARFGLRLRARDDRPPLVTLKGEGVSEAGLARRLEIEGPAEDEATWARIAAAVAPIALAARLDGLDVVQRRTTTRRSRAGLDPASSRVVLALELDTVAYELPDGVTAFHHEVELECAAPGHEDLVVATGTELERAFHPALRRLDLSKLALGFVLERLARGPGGAQALVAAGSSDVRPEVYDRLGAG